MIVAVIISHVPFPVTVKSSRARLCNLACLACLLKKQQLKRDRLDGLAIRLLALPPQGMQGMQIQSEKLAGLAS
jgi:hypothetical protein